MVILNKNIFFLLIFLLIFYLVFNTGIHADDYLHIKKYYGTGIKTFFDFSLDNLKIMKLRIPEYLIFYNIFYFANENSELVYSFAKSFIIFASFILIYSFAKRYLSKDNAKFFTFIFFFYPTKDSIFFYYTQITYSIFAAAIVLYSISLIDNDKKIKKNIGYFLILLSAFYSYSTAPYILGACLFFLIQKKKNEFFVSFFSFFLFLANYFYVSKVLIGFDTRIDQSLSIIFFVKNFIFQIISSFDANFGLSFIYKVFYSITSNNLFNLVIMLPILYFLLKIKITKNKLNIKILFLFLIIYFSSIGMYSLTGQYMQTPFNFANRVTIYSSLIVAYLVIIFFKNKLIKIFITLIILLPTFGISQHWKDFNKEKEELLNLYKIKTNKIAGLSNARILVAGNSYSKLGFLSHIDFLISQDTTRAFFKDDRAIHVNQYSTVLDNNLLLDTKFKKKYILSNKRIFVLNLSQKIFYEINIKNLKYEIKKNTKKIYRHPLQNLSFFDVIIKKYFPNLNYLVTKKL